MFLHRFHLYSLVTRFQRLMPVVALLMDQSAMRMAAIMIIGCSIHIMYAESDGLPQNAADFFKSIDFIKSWVCFSDS